MVDFNKKVAEYQAIKDKEANAPSVVQSVVASSCAPTTATTIVNIRTLPQLAYHSNAVVLPPNHVYIGRANSTYHVPSSPYANPYVIVRLALQSTREKVVEKYERWIWEERNRELRERARRELKGKVLVCWCWPPPKDYLDGGWDYATGVWCHGQVLVRIADGDRYGDNDNGSCCDHEKRNMDGGCDNCGAPSR
jgi:hypothetical protein